MSEHTPNNLSPTPEGPGEAVLATRLTDHLRAELDPQRGRSAEAFRLYALAEQQAGSRRARAGVTPRPVWRGGPWTFALVGTAVAASLAFLVTTAAPLFRGWGADADLDPVLQQPVRFLPAGEPQAVRTDSTTHTHFYDAGTTYDAQGRPMRRIRRVNVRENHWRNEATGEQVDQLVPSEEDVLYEMKTY
jgi:hypothetical protein